MTIVTDRKGNLIEIREDDAEPADLSGFAKAVAGWFLESLEKGGTPCKQRIEPEH